MATINGELSSLGPGSGAAVVLRNDNTALGILSQGQRARDLRAQREAAAKLKRDADLAKEFNDRLQYKTSGDPYYGQALQDRVYSGYEQKLANIIRDPTLSPFEKTRQSAALQQDTQNLGIRATADAKSYDDLINRYESKPELYNKGFAGTYLADRLHTADGKRALPNEVDALGIQRDVESQAGLYNEKGWVDELGKTLFPERSEKYATAGQLGGTHTMNEAKVRLVKTDGQGTALLNADRSPVLDINDSHIAAIKAFPQTKLLLEKRIADYEKLREKDPSLPKMSERGHVAQMVSHLANYDQSRVTALNPQVPRTSAGSGPKFTTNDPNAGGFARTSIITNKAKGSTAGNATFWESGTPILTSSTGKKMQRTADNVVIKDFIRNQPGQSAELVKNNVTPQSLAFGPMRTYLRTPTGNIIRPTQEADTKDEAAYEKWYAKARAENPKATPEWYVNATPKKGDNEVANEEDVFNELYDANRKTSGGGKGKSEAELRSQARKLVGERNASFDIPYNEENARLLNGFTDNFYEQARTAGQRKLDAVEARTRPRVTGPASLIQGPAAPRQSSPPAQPSGASRFRKTR